MKAKSSWEIAFKVFVILGLLLVIGFHFQSKESIVYVDSARLINDYKGMQAARTEFEVKTNAWKANLDTLRMELEADVRQYELKRLKLSAKEKALTEELLKTKQEQYLSYQNVVAEKIQTEDEKLTSRVLGEVNDYIKKHGEEKGYAIIMAATEYGNIVYSENGKDITAEVLEGLNAKMPN